MKDNEILTTLKSIIELIIEIKKDHLQLYEEINRINRKIEYRERHLIDIEEVYDLMNTWDFDNIED
tara:strand:- start:22753 stop:22950 length:198 start_codon:yes stop_codon:yes gene_type:complete